MTRKVHPKATEHLRAMEACHAQIRKLMRQASRHKGQLAQIAVEAFNEASEPIDGVTIDRRDIVTIGFATCSESPIGVCVYGREVIPIPGQVAFEEMRKANGGKDWDGTYWDDTNYPDSARTDACLYCGRVVEDVLVQKSGTR